MKTYYQVTYQLGGNGKAHKSFRAALRDLRACRRAARKSGDLQGIGLRKFTDRYSDHSDVVALTEDEQIEIAAV